MARLKMSTVKAKGRITENAFVDYMDKVHDLKLERRRLKGAEDEGDITGWDSVCVEVKCSTGSTVTLTGYLKELEAEKKNSGADLGFIASRPLGKPYPEDWYCVLPLPEMMRLLQKAGYL